MAFQNRIYKLQAVALPVPSKVTKSKSRRAFAGAETVAVMAAVSLLIGLVGATDHSVRLLLSSSIVITAAMLAVVRSTYLIDFLLVVVIFIRQLRRVLDWGDGVYDATPLLSLSPLVIGGLMVLVVLGGMGSLDKALYRAGLCFAAAIAYGMVMGLKYGLASIYSGLGYVFPIATFYYAVVISPTRNDILRWYRTLSVCAVIAAVYGFVQWAIVPEWDSSWVMWSGMYTSMSLPVPFKFNIASTLASRGVASIFFGTAAAAMLLNSQSRAYFSWGGLTLVVGALLLTRSRVGIGILLVGFLFGALLQSGAARVRLICAFAACFFVVSVAVPYLPESERIISRVETLSNITEDSSFKGRVGIAQWGFARAISSPYGLGIGSSSSTVNKFSGQVAVGVTDNGWLGMLCDLGLVGFVLYMAGIWGLFKYCMELRRELDFISEPLVLGVAIFAATTTFMAVSNLYVGEHAAFTWLALAAGIAFSRRELEKMDESCLNEASGESECHLRF